MFEKLRAELEALIKEKVPVQTLWATVKEVDADAQTCTCIVDDLEYYNVLLSLGKILKLPTVGSKCLLGIVENKSAATFIIMAESYDSILLDVEEGFMIEISEEGVKLNGDNFGGLVKHDSLMTELNKLKAQLSAVMTAVGAAVPVPGDGGAVLKGAMTTAYNSQPEPDFSDHQNQNVTHG